MTLLLPILLVAAIRIAVGATIATAWVCCYHVLWPAVAPATSAIVAAWLSRRNIQGKIEQLLLLPELLFFAAATIAALSGLNQTWVWPSQTVVKPEPEQKKGVAMVNKAWRSSGSGWVQQRARGGLISGWVGASRYKRGGRNKREKSSGRKGGLLIWELLLAGLGFTA